MKLSKDPVFHNKSKKIEIRYHYIWDMAHRGELKLQYVEMDEKIANFLTNPLVILKFEYFMDKLGVV